MTPAERANPKMIDGSRRSRIAKGSGRTVSDVNQLVDRFFQARRMMESMASGGGMPGMPGMPGHGHRQAGQGQAAAAGKQAKGKRVSGNPAKRAQQGQEVEEKPAANPFGLPQGGDQPAEFDPQLVRAAEGPGQVPQVVATPRTVPSGRQVSGPGTAGGRTSGRDAR